MIMRSKFHEIEIAILNKIRSVAKLIMRSKLAFFRRTKPMTFYNTFEAISTIARNNSITFASKVSLKKF